MKEIKNLKVYKKVLIVVDMVNGFVREGALADKHIEGTINNQLALIKKYQEEGNLVIFIKDTHTKDSVEHDRFGRALHCIEGTKEAELIEELKPFENKENSRNLREDSAYFSLLSGEWNFKYYKSISEYCLSVGPDNLLACTFEILEEFLDSLEHSCEDIALFLGLALLNTLLLSLERFFFGLLLSF